MSSKDTSSKGMGGGGSSWGSGSGTGGERIFHEMKTKSNPNVKALLLVRFRLG
jgi:hypothetical protein